MELIINYLQ